MSNELATIKHTQEQLKLITSTVAKGATADELKLFLYRANNLGLDPLKPGQIHFVKYGNSPGTIVVGIDGLRAKANRTGKLNGIKRGALRDESGKLIGGWAEVYRTDWQEPAREEVPLSEYSTGKGPWQKMPETMIKKVAEAAALRMAFPDEFGGVYVAEEMAQETQVRDSAPKALAQEEITAAINKFVTVCEQSQDKYGTDFYKKHLKNSKGESPTFDQILTWKSERQIEWLKSATAAMESEMACDDLPPFEPDVEVFGA